MAGKNSSAFSALRNGISSVSHGPLIRESGSSMNLSMIWSNDFADGAKDARKWSSMPVRT
jgi:hypothetical protein